jgi:alkylhydroperoxidase family enzyme
MARIPRLTPESAGDEAGSVLAALPAKLNIFRVMAHADSCFVPQLQLGAAILTRQQLGHVDRELLILLVARLEGGAYEWHQHVPIARGVGVDPSRIEAIDRLDLGSDHFSERERALLAFGRQVTEDVRADDATFSALKSHLSDREIVEAILTIGFYMTMARLTETTGTDLDAAEGHRVFEAARSASDS